MPRASNIILVSFKIDAINRKQGKHLTNRRGRIGLEGFGLSLEFLEHGGGSGALEVRIELAGGGEQEADEGRRGLHGTALHLGMVLHTKRTPAMSNNRENRDD